MITTLLQRAVRFYGLHAPDKGKYRVVNFAAPHLEPVGADPVIVRAPHGFRMSLDLGEHIQQRAYYLGYHEALAVRHFAAQVQPGTTVMDLGANFGQFALVAAHLLGKDGRVIAFEPSPEPFAALQRNVALNHFDQVLCRQAAVGAEAGTATFYVSHRSDTGVSSLAQAAVAPYADEMTPIQVAVEALDDYLDAPSIARRVSLIKMDVQGAELLALKGARALLRRDRPALLVEIAPPALAGFGHRPDDVRMLLDEAGYTCHMLPARPWQALAPVDWGREDAYDLLCLHESGTGES